MSKSSLKYVLTTFIYLICITQVVLGSPSRNFKLEQAIWAYYLKHYPTSVSQLDFAIKYFPAYVDLNGDGKNEVVVYIFGDCGAMACPLEIWIRTRNGYRIISELRPVHTPIWISKKRNNGWHNIVVMEGGTAADKPFRSAYRFDGKAYVEDATDHGLRGKMIITNNISPLDAIPLKIKYGK